MTSQCPVKTQTGADRDNKFLPNSGDFKVGPSHAVRPDFWQKGSPVWKERLGSDSLAISTLQVLRNMEQIVFRAALSWGEKGRGIHFDFDVHFTHRLN